MPSVQRIDINGAIDTNQTVLSNIQKIAATSQAFVTWDPVDGNWTPVINTTGSSVATFDDSNIIGSINVTSSGISDLYNSVRVQFPNADQLGAMDERVLNIASADRFAQELDNVLDLTFDIITDPVQAELLAAIELKQSRIDKIIEFTTDFTSIGLKPGDIIGVKNEIYFDGSTATPKLFRIVSIEEIDSEDGGIILAITGIEYDSTIYSTLGLTREQRQTYNAITPATSNICVLDSDADATGKSVGRLLDSVREASTLFNDLVGTLLGDETVNGKFPPEDVKENQDRTALLGAAKKPPLTLSADATEICEGSSVTITLTDECTSCYFDVPNFTYPYEITGVQAADLDVPLTGEVQITNGTGSITITPTTDGDTAMETMQFACGENTVSVEIYSTPTVYVSSVSASPSTITEGDSTTVTVNTVGYSDGSTLNYSITGTAQSKVSSPSLTGSVTLTSNTGTLTINTSDDAAYNAAENLIVTIGVATDTPCVVSSNTTTITVNNDDTTGPITPDVPKDGDAECNYVQVPVIWCGRFDEDTQYLKSMSVKKYAKLPLASTGGTAVPSSVSVTNAGTASAAISIDATVNIDATTGAGGAQIDVITSFGTLPSGGATLLTGTTSTFTGFWD